MNEYEVYNIETGQVVAFAGTRAAAYRVAESWGWEYDFRPYDEDPTAGFVYPTDR